MLWFKHDADATQDAKIKKLVLRYGVLGYGIYFHCLELIAAEISESNITFELEHDAEIIADDLKIKGNATQSAIDIVEEVMKFIVELDLFTENNGHIFCFKLLKRLDTSMTSSQRLRELITSAKKNHDSVMMNHDSVMQEEKRKEEKRKEEIHTYVESETLSGEEKPKSFDENVINLDTKRNPPIPYQEIVDVYHEALPMLSQVYKLTNTRKQHIKTLFLDKEHGLNTVEEWKKYFRFISRSDFLTGKIKPSGDRRPFIADFDFIIKPSNFVKICEDKYHGKKRI